MGGGVAVCTAMIVKLRYMCRMGDMKMLSLSVSQDSYNLEKELDKKQKELPSILVGQSTDMVVGSYQ